MTFEQQITKLCEEVVACESDVQAVELARELHALMHGRIEQLRGRLMTMPQLGLTDVDKKTG